MWLFASSKQSRMRACRRFAITVAALASLALYAAPPTAYAANSESASRAAAPSRLERQVQDWVAQLSERKPFHAWQSADSQIEALGPGTHSWLVLFTKEGHDIGYMVVHAVTDGTFRLGEYGVGAFPLFSPQLLKRSLVDSGLVSENRAEAITAVKHYLHPFAAAWEVSVGNDTYWFDAKTAEQLPVDRKSWNDRFSSLLGPSDAAPVSREARVEALQLNESFDPYDRLSWLTKETPFRAKDVDLLQKRLNQSKPLRYVTEPFGDAMLYAVAVIGYQRWSNGRVDIAMDMNGTRFAPLDALLDRGRFYR
jgi:hypothetical protein